MLFSIPTARPNKMPLVMPRRFSAGGTDQNTLGARALRSGNRKSPPAMMCATVRYILSSFDSCVPFCFGNFKSG